jgi:hypothetical protein
MKDSYHIGNMGLSVRISTDEICKYPKNYARREIQAALPSSGQQPRTWLSMAEISCAQVYQKTRTAADEKERSEEQGMIGGKASPFCDRRPYDRRPEKHRNCQ